MTFFKNTELISKQTVRYRVAGLDIALSFERECDVDELLPSFQPFKISADEGLSELVCVIDITQEILSFSTEEARLLSDISIVWGDRFTFWETTDCYWTVVEGTRLNEERWVMRSSKDFKSNFIQSGGEDIDKGSLISWFCMVAFAQSGLKHKSILFHSSVVFNAEGAYGFLGKSGTGKSTHSRLWLKYLDGFELLNDDNPAIRIMPDGQVLVFGTPWSGKTPCYRNEKAELKGLVRLKQAPFNQFEKKKNKESLIALLPSCSAIRWNAGLYSTLVDLLLEIIQYVPIGELSCLPNEEAAQICNQELVNYKMLV